MEILDEDFDEEGRIQWGLDKELYDEAAAEQLRQGGSVNPGDPGYFTPFGGGGGDLGGGVGDFGGFGGWTGGYGGGGAGGEGNFGTYDPFSSNEYLQFGTGLADIEAARGQLGEAEGFWDIGQDRKWDEINRQIPGQYNQRGMLDSGLLGRAQGLAATDRQFETDLYDWQMQNQLGSLDRQEMALNQGLAAAQGQGLADQFGAGMMIGGPPGTGAAPHTPTTRPMPDRRQAASNAAKAFGADLPYDDPWWGQPAVPGSSITNWQVHSPELSR